MRKSASIILINLFFILSLFSLAFSEDMTITTYYPSPYGSYNELRAYQMSIGSGYTATGLSDGVLIVSGSVGISTATIGSYKLRVAGGSAAVDAGQSWTTTSDARVKKDIVNLGSTLSKLAGLRGVRYHTLQESAQDPMHIGFVAQELGKEFPEAVVTGEDGYEGIDYGKITPILVEAIKELKAKNDALNSKNTQLEDRVKALESRLR